MWSFSKKVASGEQAAERRKGFFGPGRQGAAWGQLRPGAGGVRQVPSPFLKTDLDRHKLQQYGPIPNVSNKRNSLSGLRKTLQALADENKQVNLKRSGKRPEMGE